MLWNPEITQVNIGVGNNPGILISGHDLNDLEQLLMQTEGSGVDVYTHSEMLPANAYPKFKNTSTWLVIIGNAWHRQLEEFESFNGLFFLQLTVWCLLVIQHPITIVFSQRVLRVCPNGNG